MSLFDEYRPNPHVLEALRKVSLVAVVGPSGSGKTTLIRGALERDPQLHVVISDTSRAQRPKETDGLDYFFRRKSDMIEGLKRQEYVQVALSNSGDLYATHVANYPARGLALMTIWADAMSIFQQLPFKTIRTIFVTPPSFEVWQQRLGLHQFDERLHGKRLAEARRSFEYALAASAVHFIINDELERAIIDFIDLAHHRLSAQLQHDQTTGRTIIQSILQRLPV